MNLLISIKPEYVEKIKSGKKLYEFRKVKINKVKDVYIYETAPIKKITIRCNFVEMIEDKPKNIWKKYKKYSGINKKNFFNYFKEKEKAYAYKIENVEIVDIELNKLCKNNMPPISFYYISE